MTTAEGQVLRRRLLALRPDHRARFAASLADREGLLLSSSWPVWSHPGQCAPEGDWRTWVIMAGRGFGKTRAGAEWITSLVRGNGGLRIALVAASLDEARRIMVEGESGLLRVAAGEIASWQASRRLLRFASGAEATLFSGCSPEALRGPEHHLAWCDELAKWEQPEATWQMLQLGLRLGDHPRALITTTPRSGSVLARIIAEPGCVVTRGRSHANPHVSPAWLTAIDSLYAGTRLAAQEIDGALLAEEGALWSEALLAGCRATPPRSGEGDRAAGGVAGGLHPHESPCADPPPSARWAATAPFRGGFTKIAIGVDPPSGGGTCGIVLCARDAAGIGHVLADLSLTGASPERWAEQVAQAARDPLPLLREERLAAPSAAAGAGNADCPAPRPSPVIVAEANQGGKMVAAVLRAADPALRVKLVHASDNKHTRADPVSLKFQQGRVKLHGRFPELEASSSASPAAAVTPAPAPARTAPTQWSGR